MELLDGIQGRYSCRSYRSQPVSREVLSKLVDAGRMAPSGRAEQPWEFVVVTERARLQELAALADSGPFIGEAAACVAVLCRREAKYAIEDGAAATENILLCATGLGLGSCWVAGDKKPYAGAVEKFLGAPALFKLITLIPVGFPAVPGIPERSKRPLSEVLHWEHY